MAAIKRDFTSSPEDFLASLNETPQSVRYFRTEKELKSWRARMYALNKNNATFRLRSMQEGLALAVWKMRKGGTIV